MFVSVEDFFRKYKQKIIIGIIGCLLLSFFVPFTIALIARAGMQRDIPEASIDAAANTEAERRRFSISDLFLDDRTGNVFSGPSYSLLRKPQDSWNREQVDAYFIRPETILIEVFSEYNDNYIKEFFNTID
ncbi:MAG: hypothetical protein JW881_09780 [Spirochaetales bacterium]|nr:hypothetical protein [Spirochaetales bacterium]